MPTQAWGRNMDLIGTFWSGIVSGKGVVVASPPPSVEPIAGQRYDLGEIVASYNRAWLGPNTEGVNSVTPAALMGLIEFLERFTVQLEEADEAARLILEGPATGGTGERLLACDELHAYGRAGLVQPCVDLQRWRARLDEYAMAVHTVPPDLQYDRDQTLWSVTAPLFVGFYGGPTGHEEPLAAGGFPPGFNAELQHPPDIATPYMLANAYGVEAAWNEERKARLWDDLTPTVDPAVLNAFGDLETILIYAAVGTAGLIVLSTLLRR